MSKRKKKGEKHVDPLNAAFFILWNKLSDLPPRVEFKTLGEAEKVGESMARRTGQAFHIMKVLKKIELPPPPMKVTTYI